MNAAERERLVCRMSGEPPHPVGLVINCAAGLGFLALIVVIGTSANNIGSVTLEATVTERTWVLPPGGGPAGADRKQVFDARRAQMASGAPPHIVAAPAKNSTSEYVAP